MPRLVLYQQTYHVTKKNGEEEYISMKPLVQNNTGVTHIVLAAIHINDGGEITLNDHTPDDTRFEELWEEASWLKSQGVYVMGMLGGAGVGSYQRLAYGWDHNYPLLLAFIRTYALQGIDLDVEEPTELIVIFKLINALRQDMGAEFIITLAPVYAALLPRSRAFTSLSSRLLNETHLPRADPVTEALCRAKTVHSTRNLSGFSYLDLERMQRRNISWYNVQMYNGWGDATAPAAYQQLIQAGWPPERLVMGVLTCPAHGNGHRELGVLLPVIQQLVATHGAKFGGVMGWEYFDAEAHLGRQPWEWVKEIARAMGRVQ